MNATGVRWSASPDLSLGTEDAALVNMFVDLATLRQALPLSARTIRSRVRDPDDPLPAFKVAGKQASVIYGRCPRWRDGVELWNWNGSESRN